MTAVIYARYSSDNQREESVEGQIRECTAYGVCRKEWHYADLILNGEPEEYLKNTAGSRGLED